MSDRERSSPTLLESGLKTLIGGRDSNYPLISGINGKCIKQTIFFRSYFFLCVCLFVCIDFFFSRDQKGKSIK